MAHACLSGHVGVPFMPVYFSLKGGEGDGEVTPAEGRALSMVLVLTDPLTAWWKLSHKTAT